jgi:peptidyl-prolyl cis-trans isomerase D
MAGNNQGSGKNDLVKAMSKGLKTGRLSTKGIIAMVLFGAIILVFILSGLAKDRGFGSAGFAARVNNSLISMADLRSQESQLEQMYAPLFGGKLLELLSVSFWFSKLWKI